MGILHDLSESFGYSDHPVYNIQGLPSTCWYHGVLKNGTGGGVLLCPPRGGRLAFLLISYGHKGELVHHPGDSYMVMATVNQGREHTVFQRNCYCSSVQARVHTCSITVLPFKASRLPVPGAPHLLETHSRQASLHPD